MNILDRLEKDADIIKDQLSHMQDRIPEIDLNGREEQLAIQETIKPGDFDTSDEEKDHQEYEDRLAEPNTDPY